MAEVPIWDSTFRKRANESRVIIEIHKPASGASAGGQSELVRAAVGRSPSAIIIVPDPREDLSEALKAAKAAGIGVVAIGGADLPYEVTTRVDFANLRETTEQLVDAVRKGASDDLLDPDGPAVILVREPADPSSKRRAAVLRHVLEASGVKVLPDLRFTGVMDPAIAELKKALTAHPEISMVFTLEDQGGGGAGYHRYNLKQFTSRRFVIGSFGVEDRTLELSKSNMLTALVLLNIPSAAVEALNAATALAEGKPYGARVEVPTPLRLANGDEKFLFPFLPGQSPYENGGVTQGGSAPRRED